MVCRRFVLRFWWTRQSDKITMVKDVTLATKICKALRLPNVGKFMTRVVAIVWHNIILNQIREIKINILSNDDIGGCEHIYLAFLGKRRNSLFSSEEIKSFPVLRSSTAEQNRCSCDRYRSIFARSWEYLRGLRG